MKLLLMIVVPMLLMQQHNIQFSPRAVAAGGITLVVGRTTCSANPCVLTQPSNCVNGDVLLAFISADDDDVISAPADVTAWTQLDQVNASRSSTNTGAVFRKVVASCAGEEATYSFTNADSGEKTIGVALFLRGVDNSTPEDVANSNATLANDGTPEAPSITTATNGAAVFCFLAGDDDNVPIGHPSTCGDSADELADFASAAGGAISLNLAWSTQSIAAATGVQEWTGVGTDNEESIVFVFAFRPAS